MAAVSVGGCVLLFRWKFIGLRNKKGAADVRRMLCILQDEITF